MEGATDEGIELSVVIPVYNEEDVLPELFSDLSAAFDSWVTGRWEVIFVDDGSTDQTASLIAGQNATIHVSSQCGYPGTSAIRRLSQPAWVLLRDDLSALSMQICRIPSPSFTRCIKPAGLAPATWPMAFVSGSRFQSCSI